MSVETKLDEILHLLRDELTQARSRIMQLERLVETYTDESIDKILHNLTSRPVISPPVDIEIPNSVLTITRDDPEATKIT